MTEEEQEFSVPKEINSFHLREKIGFGAFSSVYLAFDDQTQCSVAIKVITKGKIDSEKLKREVELLKRLDHPFCVSFYEFLEDEHFYYIVMEYVEGRTVFKLINMKGALPEWLCRHIFCQLISALEYLHDVKKLVHRDLKAENIMIDKYGNIRLIDFGLSNQFSENSNVLQTACGSPAYAPPEMFKGQPYNSTADLWSAGVVLFAMAVGKLPFEDQHMQKLIQKILTAEPNYPENLNPQLVDLLRRMLMKDRYCRMSIKKIRDHPWFTRYHYSHLMNSDFGLIQGFRIHNNSFSEDVDLDVIEKLDNLGYDGKYLSGMAKKDVFTSLVTPYRILHRVEVSGKMRGMYSTAEKSEYIKDHQEQQIAMRPPLPNTLLVQRESMPGARHSYHQRNPLTKGPNSFSLVDKNGPIVAQSTSLSNSKNAPNTQSLKVAARYRVAGLSALNRANITPKRLRPRTFSLTPSPVRL